MGDGYTPGNCTWYVSSLCPWIPLDLGNADTWLANAKAAGLTTTQTPAVGAVACWEADSGGAGADGHVAYVTGISGGLVVVTEMNWTEVLGHIDTRSVPPANISGYILPPVTATVTGDGMLIWDPFNKILWSFWLGNNSEVYFKQAATAQLLAAAPLQSVVGGAPGTKAILGVTIDGAGNLILSLHGGNDSVWYFGSTGGAAPSVISNDAQATLLP